MLDGPLMLQLNLPVADTIHPQTNTFVTDSNINAIGDPNALYRHLRFVYIIQPRVVLETNLTIPKNLLHYTLYITLSLTF